MSVGPAAHICWHQHLTIYLSHQPHFRDRARSFNNKGLVNEYRKPKLAYRVVKGIYTDHSDPYDWGSTLK
ncbi:hypothetical protein C0638_20390 [Paenibacillus sp. lzh-N1]|nr:hypothetical protein C0638_20390 [Paenibacillus sp. lzh-N1]